MQGNSDLFNDGFCFFVHINNHSKIDKKNLPDQCECINCGFTINAKIHPLNIVRSCDKPKTVKDVSNNIRVPSIVRRLGNFGVAYLRHIADGNETSTQTEIDARFSICLKCTLYYDGVKKICKECGCNVNNSIYELNKLAWKESKCGMKFW